ncbi:MAG TPA: dihydrolipoamide acetyltransferase family protein [Candidatus Binatia bacterium]|nr:dihydrolipoamide acetyltransferase family protein [Candidatus Binatia bacterium]
MDIKLPRLSEGVESGTVVNILVAEGQAIKKDQPFMELETQKAVGSIPSPESGTVTKIHVKEGMEVAVGQVLISIDAQRGDGAATPSSAGGVQAKAVPQRAQPAAAPTARQPGAAEQPDDYRYKSTSGLPPPAAPSIRKIASDLGIDLTRVKGSESGGRIVLEDLRAYIERLQHLAYETKPSAAAESRSEAPAKAPASEAVDFSRWGPVRREKLSPLRRTVSQRMVQSWTTVPKINQFDDADITRLLALRKKYAAAYEQKQTRLTLTAFIVKAVAGALKKHPRTNASLDETTQEIVYKDYCHIGIAVDTEGGLIVPVLHDADKKNLFELSSEINGLTERTRARKIAMQELQGGSFTISNQGSIGGSHFTPIVYAPQVAILGVGQGGAKPVIADGKIVVRTLLPLCFAYDHRVLDGADAVRFLKDVIHSLEAFPESEVALG